MNRLSPNVALVSRQWRPSHNDTFSFPRVTTRN